MKILLSSIAKNDIKLLMRIFNAQTEKKGLDFLDDLTTSVDYILEKTQLKSNAIAMNKMANFPVNIHYIFESEESLFITAIFKED